jgi:hypothetical protein
MSVAKRIKGGTFMSLTDRLRQSSLAGLVKWPSRRAVLTIVLGMSVATLWSVRDSRQITDKTSSKAANTDDVIVSETSLIGELAEQDGAVPDTSDGAESSDDLANGTGEWPTPSRADEK